MASSLSSTCRAECRPGGCCHPPYPTLSRARTCQKGRPGGSLAGPAAGVHTLGQRGVEIEAEQAARWGGRVLRAERFSERLLPNTSTVETRARSPDCSAAGKLGCNNPVCQASLHGRGAPLSLPIGSSVSPRIAHGSILYQQQSLPSPIARPAVCTFTRQASRFAFCPRWSM